MRRFGVLLGLIFFLSMLASAVVNANLLMGGPGTSPTTSEEVAFLDPTSPTWLSVTSQNGCSNVNGGTDATDCIQNGINAITANNNNSTQPILYFPAGTYKINPPTATATGTGQTVTVSSVSGAPIVAGMVMYWNYGSQGCYNNCAYVTNVAGSTLTLCVYNGGASPCGGSVALSSTPVSFAIGIEATQGACAQEIALVGHSPSDTTISWGGPTGGTMLHAYGLAYSKISRLTFEGNNTAGIAMNASAAWNCFDTTNVYEDDVFRDTVASATGPVCGPEYTGNCAGGLTCGILLNGCASIVLLRDQFINNPNAGFIVWGDNALDVDCYWCNLSNNGKGAWLPLAGGAINFYNSNFASNGTDFVPNYREYDTMMGNFSSGSGQVLGGAGVGGGGSGIAFVNNTIMNTTNPVAVQYGNWGSVIMIGNKIQSKAGNAAPAVQNTGSGKGNILSVGNTYTVGSLSLNCTNATTAPVSSDGLCHEITGTGGDTVASISAAAPLLPGPPPIFTGAVQEITAASCSGTAIQNAINALGSAGGVVHVQAVGYNNNTCSIGATINIPANWPVQIIGDGVNTRLDWGGSTGVPMFTCPQSGSTGANVCKATFRDFQITGGSLKPIGIQINNADGTSPGRITMVQPTLSQNSVNNIKINGVTSTNVQSLDMQDVYTSNAAQGTTSIASTSGNFNSFSSGVGGNWNEFSVSGSGYNVAIISRFLDGDGANSECTDGSVSGTGNFTFLEGVAFVNSNTSPCSPQPPAETLNSFTGKAFIAGLGWYEQSSCANLATNLRVTGTGAGGQVLVENGQGTSSTWFADTSGDTNAFLNSNWYLPNTCPNGGGTWQNVLPETPSSFSCPGTTCSLITNTVAQIENTSLAMQTPLGVGATDVLLSRVYVFNGNTGYDLEH